MFLLRPKFLAFLINCLAIYTYVFSINTEDSSPSNDSTLYVIYTSFLVSLLMFFRSVLNCFLFQGVTWTFWIVFLHIAPIVQIKLNIFPMASIVDPSKNLPSVIIILLGTLLLSIGFLLPEKSGKHFYSSYVRAEVQLGFIKRTLFLGFILFLFIILRTSPSVFLLPRVEFEEAIRYVFISPQFSLMLIATCKMTLLTAACYILLNREYLVRNLSTQIYYFSVVLLAIFVSNPVCSSRLSFVGSILALFLSAGRINIKLISYFLISILPFYIFAFPLLDYFRTRSTRAKQQGVFSSFFNPDFDAYQQLLNTITFVDERGFQFGKQIVGAILFFVPSSFWHTKPISSGPLVAQNLSLRWTNLSSPLPAEAFIDFGTLGVIVYCFFAARLILKADAYIEWSRINSQFKSIALALLLILSGQLSLLLRGALLGVVGPSVILLIIYFSFRIAHVSKA